MREDRTGGFKTLGEFLVKVRKACDGEGTPDSRLVGKTGRCESGEDSQGGYLIPEEWADGIYHAALEGAIVRPRAIVLPMKKDSLKIRTLVDTSRATNYFGGITFTWAAEAADKESYITKPAVGELELNAHKLVGSLFVSNELEDDYGAFGSFMQIAFGRALRFEEDNTFIWGAGGGQPQGIMTAPATIAHARVNGFGAPVVVDMAHMAARLLPEC
jgi:HK97 family phage major capsid protein